MCLCLCTPCGLLGDSSPRNVTRNTADDQGRRLSGYQPYFPQTFVGIPRQVSVIRAEGSASGMWDVRCAGACERKTLPPTEKRWQDVKQTVQSGVLPLPLPVHIVEEKEENMA